MLAANLKGSGPYWRILALGSFCTAVTVLRPYCRDFGLDNAFPSTAIARGYNYFKRVTWSKKPTEGMQTVEFATIQLRHSQYIYLIRRFIV